MLPDVIGGERPIVVGQVVGEPLDVRAISVHHVDFVLAVAVAPKGDLASIRGPGRGIVIITAALSQETHLVSTFNIRNVKFGRDVISKLAESN